MPVRVHAIHPTLAAFGCTPIHMHTPLATNDFKRMLSVRTFLCFLNGVACLSLSVLPELMQNRVILDTFFLPSPFFDRIAGSKSMSSWFQYVIQDY